MFKRLWNAFCLTMGVSTSDDDQPRPDKWAEQKRIAAELEAQKEAERRERYGQTAQDRTHDA